MITQKFFGIKISQDPVFLKLAEILCLKTYASLLTSWFDLKNYEKLNELDLFGWHFQFKIRQRLYFYLYRLLSDENFVQQEEQEEMMSYFRVLTAYPVFEPPSNEEIELFYRFKEIYNACSVRSTIARNLDLERLYLPPKLLQFEGDADYDASLDEVLVKVNMAATDEQIISDFKHWLKHFRKENGWNFDKDKSTLLPTT